MENMPIKEELHQLIDKCDSEIMLEEAKDLLETGKAAED